MRVAVYLINTKSAPSCNPADLSCIKKELGFEPKIDFDSGISRFCDWVNTQKIKKSRYKESLVEMESKGLYKS